MKSNSNIQIKNILILSFLLSGISFSALAQTSSIFPGNFGIEIGIGHNQLFWKAEDPDGNKLKNDRTAFSLMPSARIFLSLPASSNVRVYSFLGYNEFGGRSNESLITSFVDADAMYKDRVRFQNVEAGIFGLYRISDLNVGLGTKVNRHLKMTNHYHYRNHPTGQDGWNTSEMDYFFKDWSIDAGIRMDYLHTTGISLGVESWFGLSNLEDDDEIFPMNIRQNHFRVLIGYRL
jgi:hypothetical protein